MEKRCTHSVHLFVTILLLCLCTVAGQAQRINGVAFDKLPQDYQLYPRNGQNEAQIPVTGRVEKTGWQHVSVQVFRNKQLVSHQRATIDYGGGGSGRFVVSPIIIRAEKAEYDLRVSLVSGTDSLHVVDRTNIVAGDVYVLTGQSNASAFFRDTRTNEYCRTFGKVSGTYGTEVYNPADTTWALSNQTVTAQNVGTMGFEFQQFILDKYGIPTCLVNATFHWSMAAHHANRTPENPADLTNGYGRMIYRLQKGGLAGSVKALIYRQGESEAYGEGNNWGGYFDTYYRHLKLDLPAIRQLYVFQVDVIDPAVAAAPLVRESQRVLVNKYADIQVVASVGTDGFDGLHYSEEGYKQNGVEFARLIGRDFYGDTDTDNIDAPNLRRAHYSTADRNEITLTFGEGQAMVWTDRFDDRTMTNYLYLDGQAGNVASGRADGNRVILTLNEPSMATKLTYLPPAQPGAPYRGPYLTNRRGMRALSFHEVAIADPVAGPVTTLTAPTLRVEAVSINALQLNWNLIPNATAYVLERLTPSGQVEATDRLPGDRQSSTVAGLTENTAYTFRIKAVAGSIESAWSVVDGRTPAPLIAPVLQATASYINAVTLAWQPVPDALGYVLERRRATDAGFTPVASLNPGIRSFEDNALTDNTAYVYRLAAVGRFGNSPFAEATVQTPARLTAPTLTLTVLYNNALTIGWTAVPNAITYRLERSTANQPYQPVGTFAAGVVSVTDTLLLPGTAYAYRITAFGNGTESPTVSSSVTLPALLSAPALTLTVLYNDALQVSWTPVANATNYVLERKTATQAYQRVSVGPGAVAVKDTNLTPGTLYTYRIRAVGEKTASLPATNDMATPALLPTPAIDLSVINNNGLSVSWQAVPGAATYQLERQVAGKPFETVGTFGPGIVSVSDTNLLPGTVYTYRIRALGDVTRSLFGSTTTATPRLLDSPQLVVTATSFDALRLTWKAVPGATHYMLERQLTATGPRQPAVRLDSTQLVYEDTKLIDNTPYQYTLTAYGIKTRSDAARVTATTLAILATANEPTPTIGLWPNPAREQTSLRFSAPVSGTLQVVDVRGVLQWQQTLSRATQVPLSVGSYPAGVYVIRVIRETDVLMQKLVVN